MMSILLAAILLAQGDPLSTGLGALAEKGILGTFVVIGFGLFLRSESKRDEERKAFGDERKASADINTKLTDSLRELAVKSNEAITKLEGTVRDLAQRITQ
jgi:hypothetical protein